MNKATRAVFVSLGLSLLLAAAATPEKAPAKGCCYYDPAAVETIKGSVTELKAAGCPDCARGGGVHLLVKAGAETLEVRLGPKEYLGEKNFEVKAGDEVEVTGSRLAGAEPPALVAREIRKGERRVELRQMDGTPRWACGGDHHCQHGQCGHGGCGVGGGRCCRGGGRR